MKLREINFKTILDNGLSFEKTLIARQKAIKNENAGPESFVNIFGDLASSIFEGSLTLEGLNLSSLEGSPFQIYDGYFAIDNNQNLKSLNFSPTVIDYEYDTYVDAHLLVEMLRSYHGIGKFSKGKPKCVVKNATKESFEDLLLSVVVFAYKSGREDLLRTTSHIGYSEFQELETETPEDLLLTFGNSKIVELYINGKTKKLLDIYHKVGNDREKLDRALELL